MKKVVKESCGPGGISHDPKHFAIFCPACKCRHLFDGRWNFNGDMDVPTFHPSMLIHENKDYRERSNDKHGHRCHSFVVDGKIQFLDDCTHQMKNQTVKLEAF